ncbi:MAG TPA: SGNH/GDSL hydrolase family protein [Lapillicoccus sp.]|nr:SGNH/GDSL hydrolase family protein [Lapillicoccus sp.]
MNRRPAAAATALAAVVALVLAGCSGAAQTPSEPEGILATITTPPPSPTRGPRPEGAPTPTATSTTQAPPTGWYLALGDSLAAGNQPGGDQKERGYAGPVLDGLRKSAPDTQLKNLGCSGETTSTMLRGGICSYPERNQVAAAVAFLKANADNIRLVTLDIGANNVLTCAQATIDTACGTRNTAAVAKELTPILAQIRAAAPKAPIVVLTYYNPLLAAWRTGPDGQKYAQQSQPLLAALNAEITKAAKPVSAKVADIAATFATNTTSGSPQPTNVKRICDWTWMCSKDDIHANDAGYAQMARAVLAAR